LKGTETKTVQIEPEIQLKLDAYIPGDYINDERQKIEMYKKVRGVTDQVDLQELEDELMDRFGELPSAVINLLYVARLKLYAKQAGIEEVKDSGQQVTLKFQDNGLKTERLVSLAQKFR